MNENGVLKSDILDKEAKLDDYCAKICRKLKHKQIAELINELKNKSCNNCNNDNCQVDHGLESKDSVSNQKENYCPMWFNPVLVGKCKLLKK